MANGGFLQEEEKASKSFYQRAVWWIEHRGPLKRIGTALLAVFDATFLAFSAFGLLDAFVLSVDREDRAVAEMVAFGQVDLRQFSLAHAAKPLSVSETQILALSDQRYDFSSTLSNPNKEWYAEFRYAFMVGDQETDEASSFILPSEEKPIVSLAFALESKPARARLEIRHLAWHRVDAHAILDYDRWKEDRLGWEISDVVFSRDLQIDGEEIGRMSFSAVNRTAFSYWEPVFTLRLMRGNSVVGVSRTTMDRFESGDARDVTVHWFGAIPAVTRVEVIPEVNLFNSEEYMPLKGENARDIRERVLRDRSRR
jgi:hypothetical protein